MIPVRPADIRHKTQLLRFLTEIADNSFLAQNLYFKGGTCAAALGFLDRFSVDLDFDLNPKADVAVINKHLKTIFDDQSDENIVKIDKQVIKANVYKPQFLPEIDRALNCQTIETMFANKLVAPLDRYNKHHSIAGRDIYDIHYFFLQGLTFEKQVIKERTSLPADKYLQKLYQFIEKEVTETLINEDLNTLLLPEKFQKVRKVLKTEVMTMLRSFI